MSLISLRTVFVIALITTSASYYGQDRPVLQSNTRYQLQQGDVFELDFRFTPDFNQTVTVQPDGYITLRGVGDVRAEGETVPSLTKKVEAAYTKILREPVITVLLKDFEKPYFVTIGQVAKPGKYELRGNVTVTDAIAMAGGFDETAKHSQVLVFRRLPNDWAEVKKVNVKQMLKSADVREDVYLQPGDLVFVPKNVISRIRPFLPYPQLGLYLNPLPR